MKMNRREFVRGAAVLAAAGSVAGHSACRSRERGGAFLGQAAAVIGGTAAAVGFRDGGGGESHVSAQPQRGPPAAQLPEVCGTAAEGRDLRRMGERHARRTYDRALPFGSGRTCMSRPETRPARSELITSSDELARAQAARGTGYVGALGRKLERRHDC